MSISNIGPEHPDPNDPDAAEAARRGNPPLVYRDEPITDEVAVASSRASAVTHRFGGVHYALSRRDGATTTAEPPAEEGESDARQ